MLNALIPVVVVKLGYFATCALRVVQGLGEGILYPSCYAVMRHWTTPRELSRLGGMVLTGVYIGPFVGLLLAGSITHRIGWVFVFYLSGAC